MAFPGLRRFTPSMGCLPCFMQAPLMGFKEHAIRVWLSRFAVVSRSWFGCVSDRSRTSQRVSGANRFPVAGSLESRMALKLAVPFTAVDRSQPRESGVAITRYSSLPKRELAPRQALVTNAKPGVTGEPMTATASCRLRASPKRDTRRGQAQQLPPR